MSAVGLTVLGSGSKGNAIVVHNEHSGLLIDAGLSLRQIRLRMAKAGLSENLIKGILVTHEHTDHVRSIRTCSEYFEVPVYASRLCAEKLKENKNYDCQPVLFTPGGSFELGEFNVLPFSVGHDAVEPVGFVVTCGSKKIGIALDLGRAGQTAEFLLRSCDTLAIESNHDLEMLAASGRPWYLKQRILGPQGHLSNQQGSELLGKVLAQNTRNVALVHISEDCNTFELAKETAAKKLNELQRNDVVLKVAKQKDILPTLWA
jgi:phosphoribosyl 1,2-cyclic phosphodiesterase